MGEAKESKGRMIQHVEQCKECGYCVQQCPTKALTFSSVINKKGYNTVHVDEEKCTCCAICYTVCPDNVYERVEG